MPSAESSVWYCGHCGVGPMAAMEIFCFTCNRKRDAYAKIDSARTAFARTASARIATATIASARTASAVPDTSYVPVMRLGRAIAKRVKAIKSSSQKSKRTIADMVSENKLSDISGPSLVKNELPLSETNSAGTPISPVTHQILSNTIQNDPELATLYTQAFQCMNARVFEKTILQLLKTFYRDLYRDAQTESEKVIAKNFKVLGKQLAHEITMNYNDANNTPPYRIMNQKRIKEYSQSPSDHNPASGCDSDGEDQSNESDEVDELSGDDEMDLFSYPLTLQMVNTLKSGPSFRSFKKNIRRLVELKSAEVLALGVDHDTQTIIRREIKRDSTWNTFSTRVQLGVSRLNSLSSSSFQRLIIALTRPTVRRGYQRITWICGCGRSMYTDVQETYEGGAMSLQNALRQAAISAGQPSTGRQPKTFTQSSTSTNIPPPPSPRIQSRQTSRSSSNNLSHNRIRNVIVIQVPSVCDRFLLLCVNGRRLMELKQLKICENADDQVMFQDIREAYLEVRRARAIDIHPDTPQFFRRIILLKQNIANILQSLIIRLFECLHLQWLVWWLGNSVFYIPISANFVRFELIPIKMTVCPEVLGFPDMPPEKEVRNGNYHYVPCPQDVKNPLLRIPYLHVLFEPGNHLDEFWINRSPKKLKSIIEYSTGFEPVIGWGVQIVEGPNWIAFSVLSEIVLVLSLALSVLYSVCKADVSSGFTIGSYMVAALTAINACSMVFLAQQN